MRRPDPATKDPRLLGETREVSKVDGATKEASREAGVTREVRRDTETKHQPFLLEMFLSTPPRTDYGNTSSSADQSQMSGSPLTQTDR